MATADRRTPGFGDRCNRTPTESRHEGGHTAPGKKCPHGDTRHSKCSVCQHDDDQLEIERLQQELSLAEEGLANFTGESARFRSVPSRRELGAQMTGERISSGR